MNEITSANSNALEKFRNQGRVYKTSIYAFTFEQVYLIYYYKRAAGKENFLYDYTSININTGISSHVSSRKNVLIEDNFRSLIPDIIRSIKYTGDKRNVAASRSMH